MKCMVMTSSEQHSVLFQPNLEKSDNLKRLKGHLVNGCPPYPPLLSDSQTNFLAGPPLLSDSPTDLLAGQTLLPFVHSFGKSIPTKNRSAILQTDILPKICVIST